MLIYVGRKPKLLPGMKLSSESLEDSSRKMSNNIFLKTRGVCVCDTCTKSRFPKVLPSLKPKKLAPEKLMVGRLVSFWGRLPGRCYCWWLKSCTTWDVWNPINNGKDYLSTGAGFQPSTVLLVSFRECNCLLFFFESCLPWDGFSVKAPDRACNDKELEVVDWGGLRGPVKAFGSCENLLLQRCWPTYPHWN